MQMIHKLKRETVLYLIIAIFIGAIVGVGTFTFGITKGKCPHTDNRTNKNSDDQVEYCFSFQFMYHLHQSQKENTLERTGSED